MKTDHIFYRIFKDFPQTFFELWGESPESVKNYRFDSVELKQTAFRIDGVFLPDNRDDLLYFTEKMGLKPRPLAERRTVFFTCDTNLDFLVLEQFA